MATNFPTSLDSFTNPTSGNTLDSPSHSGQHSDINDAVEAIELKLGTGASASTAATSGYVLTAGTGGQTSWSGNPNLVGGTATGFVLVSPEESILIQASVAAGTVALNMKTTNVTYYTTNSTANWSINLRGDASTTLDATLGTGQSLTHVFLATNGTTAYYPNAFYVDGGTVTPKWQGGTGPSAGNASSIDSYSFTAIKTASSTFTVFASQTQFK